MRTTQFGKNTRKEKIIWSAISALALLCASGVLADSSHEHHKQGRILNLPIAKAPTLSLNVSDLESGGYKLTISTSNFAFSKEHVDGKHVAGEGHAHLYVNGEKIRRVYDNQTELTQLRAGLHEIRIGLYSNDHAAYQAEGEEVSDRVMIRVNDCNKYD